MAVLRGASSRSKREASAKPARRLGQEGASPRTSRARAQELDPSARRAALGQASAVPEAADEVVIDHADRLHEGVADGRTYESEAARPEGFRHRPALRRLRRNLAD